MSLNIKEEYHRSVIPRCRPPIRNIKKFNNINKERRIKPIVPKCRPSIRNIENSDKSNNNILKDTNYFVHKENIKMNNSKESSEDTSDNITDENSDNESLLDEPNKVNQSTNNFSSGDNHNVSSRITKPISPNKKREVNIRANKCLYFSFGIFTFSIIFAVCANKYFSMSQANNNESMVSKITMNNNKQESIIQEFRKSIRDARLKFKGQKYSTWNAFSSQVEEIIYGSTKVSMIILLGNETDTIKCLAHFFGRTSSKALGSDHYLILNPKNMKNDHGKKIEELKSEILNNRAVIIEDLLDIGSEAIKTLHNLCDKENPLISNTMYIITIISNDYEGLKIDKFVEDSITAKYSKFIDLDILDPLITRIMDGPVISILPEPSMKGEKNIDDECLLL